MPRTKIIRFRHRNGTRAEATRRTANIHNLIIITLQLPTPNFASLASADSTRWNCPAAVPRCPSRHETRTQNHSQGTSEELRPLDDPPF